MAGYLHSGNGPATAYGLHIRNLNIASRDPEYRAVLARCTHPYPDGNSVRIVARAAGLHLPTRMVTTDLIWPVLERAADGGSAVWFLGGVEGLARAAADSAAKRLPLLRVAGASSGYFADRDSAEVAARIRAAGADLVVVAMGVPREQVFCDRFGEATGARLLMTGGGIFGFMTGAEKRAPKWALDRGFEWVWRLAQDPVRLGPRYATGLPTVIRLALAARFDR